MKDLVFIFNFFIFLLIVEGCICQPLNTVVLEKQNSSLFCNTDNRYTNVTFIWRYGYAGNLNGIYTGQHVSSKYNKSFSVKKEGPQCELRISPVRLSHAGLYECEIFCVIPNVRKTAAAHLVVLESDPVCLVVTLNHTAMVEGDRIHLECSIRYRGGMTPAMTWKNLNNHTAVVDGLDTGFPGQYMASTVIINLRSSDNGRVFECTTSFKNTNLTSLSYNIATNTPGYNFTWTSPKLQVFYKPQKITFSTIKSQYEINDSIRCFANGNPEPTYTWKDLDSNSVIDGPLLVISGDMKPDRVYTFICSTTSVVVQRNIRWSANESLVFTVAAGKPIHVNTFAIVTGLAFGLGVLLTSIGTIVFRFRKRSGANLPTNDVRIEASAGDMIGESSSVQMDSEQSYYVNVPRRDNVEYVDFGGTRPERSHQYRNLSRAPEAESKLPSVYKTLVATQNEQNCSTKCCF